MNQNSVRARRGSTVCVSPSDQGMSWKSISEATPSVQRSQSIALAVVACIARLTGRVGSARRRAHQEATTFAAHAHDATTTSVRPM